MKGEIGSEQVAETAGEFVLGAALGQQGRDLVGLLFEGFAQDSGRKRSCNPLRKLRSI